MTSSTEEKYGTKKNRLNAYEMQLSLRKYNF